MRSARPARSTAWGVNSYGELDDGRLDCRTRPQAVKVDFPAGVTITSLANPMPFDAGLAIDSTGHASGWGLNGVDDLCLSALIEARPQRAVPLRRDARPPAPAPTPSSTRTASSTPAAAAAPANSGTDRSPRAARPHPVTGLPSGVKVTGLTSSWEGSRSATRQRRLLQLGVQRGRPTGQRLHGQQRRAGQGRPSRARKAGLPGRERADERTDRRHPARRGRPGHGGATIGASSASAP